MSAKSFAQFTLAQWSHFPKKLTDICGNGDFRGKYLFRGQRDASWPLVTSFDRRVPGTLVQREKASLETIDAFRRALEYQGLEVENTEKLVGLAQHYGLPTRTLDWSFSPYVGLFFACAGCIENGLQQRPAFFALNLEKLKTNISETEVSTISYAPDANVRLRNQKGCFTHLKGDFMSLDAFFAAKADNSIISKVSISKDAVRDCLFNLSSMDISYERLFPGTEGVAKQSWLDHLLNS